VKFFLSVGLAFALTIFALEMMKNRQLSTNFYLGNDEKSSASAQRQPTNLGLISGC
jgi:hypothetical protein